MILDRNRLNSKVIILIMIIRELISLTRLSKFDHKIDENEICRLLISRRYKLKEVIITSRINRRKNN